MAEIVADFLGPPTQVMKWVGAAITRQFSYICCFTTNINSLKHEAEKIDAEAGHVLGLLDRASEDLQGILPEVKTWLTNSNHIKDQTNAILDQVPNAESGCLNVRARFSLSKRAKKTSDRMKELLRECKFDAISLPRPPAATEAVPLGRTYEFESRKQIEEDIITTLRDGGVSMIGICGMGGLGKTTMAKRIMNRVLKEHVFEEAVMVFVSQQVDRSKIQYEIGGSLGMKLEEPSQAARLQKLHARLSGTKRILLVLDDIWKRVVLEDLGIPCDSKSCAILLTSRNRDALLAMNVQKIFGMEVLSEEEAWFFFRERAGTCVDHTMLNPIAKEVVKECRGLPVALTTVGAALIDEKDASIWNDALRQLKQYDPDIPEFIAKVYSALKLSYDFLESEPAKALFLLCCLFPEDDNIPLNKLTYFCMGLGIFEGIRNFGEARNRVRALIKMLKSRSLLLDGYNEDHVKMHDVVRDVCIYIAKQEKYIGGNDCTWISCFELLDQRNELRTHLGFPNLRLLFLSRSSQFEEEFNLDSASLERIRDLSVLCIHNYSLTSLPHTILTNLNTLVLDSCEELKTIFVVGELRNLEILMCCRCGSLEELPLEMKGLNRLKVLELTGCFGLQRIGRGIISSLVGLEELKILESFNKWEAEDTKERENAGLRELEALTNLRCLEIEIEDLALATQNMHLNSSKMERFDIRIPAGFGVHHEGFNKKLSLHLEKEICLGNWIEKQLLRDTEFLYLCGNSANSVDLTKCRNIRGLGLGKCDTINNIVTCDNAAVFSSIEYLNLFSLPKLEEIWDAPILSTSLQNLRELYLRDLVALQIWKSGQNHYDPLFPNLSSIEISGCPLIRNLWQERIAYHHLKALY